MTTTMRASRLRAASCDSAQRSYTKQRLDTYAAAMQYDPVKTPEEIVLEQEAYTKLIQRIDALPPRIGLCIKLRQGIGCEPHTLEQVGERYGVSRGRVQQIEAKGYRILKHRIWIEENPQRWRQEQENLKKIEREREASNEQARELNYRKQQEWEEEEARERDHAAKMRRAINRARQRAAEYDDAYHEAHAINALWPHELKRRAYEERMRLANQKHREEFEQRVQANERRRGSFLNSVTKKVIERDWLFVATEGAL